MNESTPPPETLERTGLTRSEALERLATDGYNELPAMRSRNVLRISLDVVRQPMFLLLVTCAAIYLALGDIREAWVLIAFVGVVMGITIVQERRTERALEALRDLSSPRALVIRDGQKARIAGRDVVRGDIVVLNEGDRVPADAVMLRSDSLHADESLLTGESVPVRKIKWDGAAARTIPGGDDQPFVYSGSLVVQGKGLARVEATGPRTELGKIGRSLGEIDSGRTRLESDTNRLVKRISVFALAVCVVAAVVYGATRGDWIGGMLAGIAIAMSLLPEEFPVVLTVFLSIGAWRIARHNVLTRRIPAIEALGAATVLCVDKTGTLTENRMQVARIIDATGRAWDFNSGAPAALPDAFHELVDVARLATPEDPFDPMERAIVEAADASIPARARLHRDWVMAREYPLSPQLLAMSHAWKCGAGHSHAIAAKGAPEAIAGLCALDAAARARVLEQVEANAAQGLRLIGIAAAEYPGDALPDSQRDFRFRFLGLVALADPVRPGVAEAIRDCYAAGIRVIMITGDFPRTALAIASRIGLRGTERALTGAELAKMTDAELAARLADTSVIARAIPEHKLRIVRALQAQGEVVSMTGDGVNDAPALKAANIGIAMGSRGSDVARESASLVVLDDNFTSIVHAVRMGRRIYGNLRKAVSYIIAVHLPIAGIALIPIFFGSPVALLPVHIAFLELIIDPACSLAFEAEPEESDTMRRPPRDPDVSLYSGRAVRFGFLEGASVMVYVLAVYFGAYLQSYSEDEIRTITFTTLVLGNLALILASRSHLRSPLASLTDRNPVVWWIVTGTLAALTAVLSVPWLRALFRLAPPTWPLSLGALAVAAMILATLMAMRYLVYGRPAEEPTASPPGCLPRA